MVFLKESTDRTMLEPVGSEASDLTPPSTVSHVRVSTDGGDLAAILDEGINLAIWDRQATPAIGSLTGFDTIQLIAPVDRVGAMLTAAFALRPRASWHAAVAADAVMLTARFAAILDITYVMLRLELVTGDACKRWHADAVPVRLICTYAGSGTQWIEQPDDRERSLGVGAVGLFKGRALAGDYAIVHRSPPIAGTGEERLLLVVDSPPPADTEALWREAMQHG